MVVENKFKIGDKVRAIKQVDGEMPTGVGVIMDISESMGLKVFFKDWNGDGHDLNGLLNGENKFKGWFYSLCYHDCLELIEGSPKERDINEILKTRGA